MGGRPGELADAGTLRGLTQRVTGGCCVWLSAFRDTDDWRQRAQQGERAQTREASASKELNLWVSPRTHDILRLFQGRTFTQGGLTVARAHKKLCATCLR